MYGKPGHSRSCVKRAVSREAYRASRVYPMHDSSGADEHAHALSGRLCPALFRAAGPDKDSRARGESRPAFARGSLVQRLVFLVVGQLECRRLVREPLANLLIGKEATFKRASHLWLARVRPRYYHSRE